MLLNLGVTFRIDSLMLSYNELRVFNENILSKDRSYTFVEKLNVRFRHRKDELDLVSSNFNSTHHLNNLKS